MLSPAEFMEHLNHSHIPYQQSLAALAARNGVRKSGYYDWNIVEMIAAKPLLQQQVGLVWCNHNEAEPDLLPPHLLTAFVGGTTNARANHLNAVDALSQTLGNPTADRFASNTLCHTWTFGPLTLKVTTWPPELNDFRDNPSIQHHPELATYAHLGLLNSICPPTTAAEAEWLRDVVPFQHQSGVRPQACFGDEWFMPGRSLRRDLPPRLFARKYSIGRSAGNTAIVVVRDASCLIVARDIITAVRLENMLPAKGRGGASIILDYVDQFSSSQRHRQMTLFFDEGKVHRLDALANEIAAWVGLELVCEETYDA